MAGAIADGQLSSAAEQADLQFAVAAPADEAAIRRLLRETPMHGTISLSFEREPDYFRGASVGGAEDTTIVARADGRIVGVGRCSTRDCWLNGEVRRVGYLGELRLDASARNRLAILRGGYRFFHELARRAPADFYFTSIAADNLRARRVLERGAAGLPRYEFLTEFVTLLVPISQHARQPSLSLEICAADELAAFLKDTARGCHLAAAWPPERLRARAQHDLPLENFRVVRRCGKIIACAALWDQRSFRQTVIRGYAPALSFFRPLLNAASYLAGGPRLPSPGSVLAHAFLSPLAFAPESESLLPDFVAAFFPFAARHGVDLLTLGFPADDPRLAMLRRRFRCRAYTSRLYRVVWPGEVVEAGLDNRPFLPEVALL